jgi:hypothetical protein
MAELVEQDAQEQKDDEEQSCRCRLAPTNSVVDEGIQARNRRKVI